jgi:group II intron reverse transcriptase/maturase
LHENREILSPIIHRWQGGPRRESYGNKAAMNGRRKSDWPIVPEKPANKAGGAPSAAEQVEGRGQAKGNSGERNSGRTQSREELSQALDRVRQAARRDKRLQFTALWHHVYEVERLRTHYFAMKRASAAGIDGETWEHYGEHLEENLQDLAGRLKRGAYRAKPVRRTYIPKPDGRQRPLGVPALEDKLVQRTVAEVMGAIYETDFKGFSYGFRPGRGQHNALDAVVVGIHRRKVSWVLDADIRGFFDAIDHEWLLKFIEHRIADQRVLRHIQKWLKAGVLEDGQLRYQECGTPQGGSISPLLANIYLHYVLDLWVERWRRTQTDTDVIVVRYADDFIVGFQTHADGERFLHDLRERMSKFGLELHGDKTRLIECGRFAAPTRKQQGRGKPETFDFLGFTHICSKTRKSGRFVVVRKTKRTRMQAKLKEIKSELRRRMHDPVPEVAQWLNDVLRGHYQYYGVPFNGRALSTFRQQVVRRWFRALRRRSHKTRITWDRMVRLQRWLPQPRVVHPHPYERLRVNT